MPWYRVIVTKAMEAYTDAASEEEARRDYTDLSYKDTGYGHVTASVLTDKEAALVGCPPSDYPWVHTERCEEVRARRGCTCHPSGALNPPREPSSIQEGGTP